GYGTLGAEARAEYSLRQAGATFRRSTVDAATSAIPGVAGVRAARWARRNPGQASALAGAAAAGTTAAAADTAAGQADDGYPSRFRPEAPAPADGEGEGSAPRRLTGGGSSARRPSLPETGARTGAARAAPPLDLPPRAGAGAGNG